MAYSRRALSAAFIALMAAGPLAGAVHAQGRYDWNFEDRDYGLRGPGVRDLVPELRDTRRGQAFVLRNFDFDHNGFIDPREARAANRAFADMAGPDRDRFGDDRRGPPGPPPGFDDRRGPPPPGPDGWDRQGMRGYHFRDGRYGAMFTLKDVLFQTASAQLRPGAADQLRPLAGYLRSHPRVRLRIDGYTDSVGSDASNVTLSQNRARSVAAALQGMGVDTSRYQLVGHGKADPVASNATAEGRQLNRRVEVTLVGEHARTFQ